MSSIPARAFSGSNRSQMGSNVFTTQAQGGGNKKAGFAHQVGRDSWSSIFISGGNPVYMSKCASLTCLQFTSNPNVSASRPIGSTYYPNTYFRVPGTR